MGLNKTVKNSLSTPLIKWVVIGIVAVMVLVVGFGAIDAALFANKVHRGVTVAGISMGGKDKEALQVELNKISKDLESKKVTIKYRSKTWIADPEKIDFEIDSQRTIDKALNAGRQGRPAQIIKGRLSLWVKPRDLALDYKYDEKKLTSLMKTIADDINEPAEDAAIKIVEDRAVITSSNNGLEVETLALKSSLLKAFTTRDRRSLSLPVGIVEPDIAERDLAEAGNIVKLMVKAPAEIRYRDQEWEIPVDKITRWITFEKVRKGDRWTIDVGLNKAEVHGYLKEQTKELTTEPKDAEFNIDGDKVVLVPSSDGTRLNLDEAYDDIVKASKSEDNRTVMLSTETVEPKLTTEDAGKMGIREKVSSYTTYYNASQTSRVHNIHTLAKELDGNIVAPSEVFSFNGTIGPRTAAKGYQEAPAILNGELVPTLGGGVCQVATTLFNTIFFGGYAVVERHNHSFYISHYPAGRDATVSYGGPDLKFKNNTDYYVLIKTAVTASSVTINFYSTGQGLKVSYNASGPTNYKPAKIEYKDDPTLEKGAQKVFDKGITGRDMTIFRSITKDGKVVKEDKFFSRYVPKKTIMKVGTKVEIQAPPEPGATQPTTPPVTTVPVTPAPQP